VPSPPWPSAAEISNERSPVDLVGGCRPGGADGVLWLLLAKKLGNVGFYVIFALAITTSVQLVGVYLVFASLVIPALAARRWAGSKGLVSAWILGAGGYLAGLYGSLHLDMPAAPFIVWCLAGLALLTALRPAAKQS